MCATQKCWIFVQFGTDTYWYHINKIDRLSGTEQFGSRGCAATAGGNGPSQTGLRRTKRRLVFFVGLPSQGILIILIYIYYIYIIHYILHRGTFWYYFHAYACWYVAILATCHGRAQSRTHTQTPVFHTFEFSGRGFSPVAVRPSSRSAQ